MFTQAVKNILIAFLLISAAPVFAVDLLSADNIKNFKILSAKKLDYKEGDSILIGDVKIKLGQYTISAPRVFVDSDEAGKPAKVRFVEGAFLESESMDVTAVSMEFDLKTSLFKCYSDADNLVTTNIYSTEYDIGLDGEDEEADAFSKKSDQMTVYSWYQEFNLDSGFVKVLSNKEQMPGDAGYNKKFDRVKFISGDMNIDSDAIEIETEDSDVKYVDFIGDVVALGQEERIQSEELFYFPDQKILKANDNVRILYIKSSEGEEPRPAYLFADLVVYERDEKLFSAYATDSKNKAEVHSGGAYGYSRQILLSMSEGDDLDRAILTGNAFAQYEDKSVLGHEILFNLQNNEIKTLVGRPHTQLLKTNEVEQEKESS